MRKFLFFLSFFLLALISKAQISANSGKKYTNLQGIDYVFVFNGITPATEITYNGNGTIINWYKFSDLTTPISNQPYISPEDATGYTLIVDGVKKNIWVIDYNNNLPVLNSIEAENNPGTQCHSMNLLINALINPLVYKSVDGLQYTIQRNFSINYQTLNWNGTAWQPKDTIVTLTLPKSLITIPTPYCNTVFTLKGDQIATDLGMTLYSVSSTEYVTNAVICKPTSIVTLRDAKNEAQRPVQASQVDGSAPLDIQFLSNANVPVAQFYNWNIYQNNISIVSRTDKDTRYTFNDAGTYKVKVTVSNNICTYSDSLTITVRTSELYVPNVFTPNGDGVNDEFRVAYTSLLTFQCWIYNRWGRLVYTWTDPTKGWDGKINGVDAKPGPYFYVIKATGSDFDPNATPNPKTHLRIGEYLKRGDINLLRGVK